MQIVASHPRDGQYRVLATTDDVQTDQVFVVHLLLEESAGALDISLYQDRFAGPMRGEFIAGANRQAQANAQLRLDRLLVPAPLVLRLNASNSIRSNIVKLNKYCICVLFVPLEGVSVRLLLFV